MELDQWLTVYEHVSIAWTLAPEGSVVEAKIEEALEGCRDAIVKEFDRAGKEEA